MTTLAQPDFPTPSTCTTSDPCHRSSWSRNFDCSCSAGLLPISGTKAARNTILDTGQYVGSSGKKTPLTECATTMGASVEFRNASAISCAYRFAFASGSSVGRLTQITRCPASVARAPAVPIPRRSALTHAQDKTGSCRTTSAFGLCGASRHATAHVLGQQQDRLFSVAICARWPADSRPIETLFSLSLHRHVLGTVIGSVPESHCFCWRGGLA